MSSLDDSIQQLPNAIPHATSQPQPEVPIGKQIQEAIRQSQEQRIVKYEEVAIISCCWRGDDTGAEQDCNLFVETMKKIQSDSCTVKASIHMINVSDRITSLLEDCVTARQQLDPAKRSLFVFHYAGHGKTNNSGDLLGLAPNGPGADPPIETRQLSDIISRQSAVTEKRVEYIAAATTEGTNNCAQDCTSFTSAWCNAFNHFLDEEKAFNTQDVVDKVNLERGVSGLSNLFITTNNDSLPTAFRPLNLIENGASEGSKMLLVAFHIDDDADDSKLRKLIEFLKKSPAPIAAVKVLKPDTSLIDVQKPESLTGYIGRNLESTSMFPATEKTGNEDDHLL